MSDRYGGPPVADRPFHVMANPAGPACNLECAYCYYLDTGDRYPEGSTDRMTEQTLETFVRQYLEASPGPEVTFTWQGGEPTLAGVDFYRRALELQEKHADADTVVSNSIQTNGTRLDDEWCRFFARNDFLVGISVDGPRRLHDAYRRTKGGGATFEQVARGLSLLQEHDVVYNVLCVVNALNSRHPLEVYEFFRERGVEWIQFVPLVEPLDEPGPGGACVADDAGGEDGIGRREDGGDSPEITPGGTPDGAAEPGRGHGVDHEVPEWVRARGGDVYRRDADREAVRDAARAAPVTDRSVDPEAYGTFMCTVFDRWVRDDVGVASIRTVDQCIETRLRGRPSLCVLDETCGRQVAVERDGDVFACDHFVDPGFRRGNLQDTHLADLVDDPDQRQFGAYKRTGRPPRCVDCPVVDYCHGGCPRNWLLASPSGEPGLNYLCAGYRRFFTYVQPYLDLFERAVAGGVPLSRVSSRVAALDRTLG